MNNELLKVPKTLKPVTLWVHPEGRVLGSIFLRNQSVTHAGPEYPLEALNDAEPFIVFKRDAPKQLRFYNRKSIIRVEYPGHEPNTTQTIKPLQCELYMMDGSLIGGTIDEPLHPNRARLLDYLNNVADSFISIHSGNDTILVNKSYINHVHVQSLEDDEAFI